MSALTGKATTSEPKNFIFGPNEDRLRPPAQDRLMLMMLVSGGGRLLTLVELRGLLHPVG